MAILLFSLLQKSLLVCVLLSVTSSLLGCFIVVRGMSLIGDSLSHAVLPGIVSGLALSYHFFDQTNYIFIFGVAMISAVVAVFFMQVLQKTTKLKQDAILGITLASFFAIGFFIKSILASKYTIEGDISQIIFGNIALISEQQIVAISIAFVVITICMFFLMRHFVVLSFDKLFSRTIQQKQIVYHVIFTFIFILSLLISMQVVGFLLSSALLIIPATSAYLFTRSWRQYLIMTLLFNLIGALVGFYISWRYPQLPTGAVVVTSIGVIFIVVFFFGPKGRVTIFYQKKKRTAIMAMENTLKAIYAIQEYNNNFDNYLALATVFENLTRNNTEIKRTDWQRSINKLQQKMWAIQNDAGDIKLTSLGLNHAKKLVRNHRLWELYLTQKANYKDDHVHDDAERMEHVLSSYADEIYHELNQPTTDPHGKPIPQ